MNTHGVPDMMVELGGTIGDLLPACVVSTTPPTVPASGLTLSAFATRAYVRAGTALTYVDQPAVTVTITGGDGQYWVAVTDDTFSTFSGWTRRAGSHYVWRASATRPADLDNLLVTNQLTVAGGNIIAVSTPWGVAPPLALSTADKVSIGGHASTGVLDVQGSVVASDIANWYFGLRVWPVAPGGAVGAEGIRIEPPTGAAIATLNYRSIGIGNLPTVGSASGLYADISAGSGRYNINARGTAQNYFAGSVGIGVDPPSYPLDVTGQARVMGKLGIQGAPGNGALTLRYPKASQFGVEVGPSDSDTGFAVIQFLNLAQAGVGSITTTATATAYNTSSDVRLKHAIAALAGALDVIAALRPVRFRWNADDSAGIGFLAHELQQVVPEAVTGEPDALNDDGSIRPQQVDHSKLIPYLTSAVQALAQQVETLAARVANLETQLGV